MCLHICHLCHAALGSGITPVVAHFAKHCTTRNGISVACADTSGSNTKVKVKATAADTTTISSNAFTVTCAGNAVNYKASTDKAVYNTGDVMTVTLAFTDKSGKPANDYGLVSKASYVGTIASGAIASTVTGPSSAATGEAASGGKKTYKYIIGQTAGTYSIAVDFPNVNNSTYSQTAITVPVSVKAVAKIVNDPPFSIFRAAPKKRFGLCKAFASTPPESTLPEAG